MEEAKYNKNKHQLDKQIKVHESETERARENSK